MTVEAGNTEAPGRRAPYALLTASFSITVAVPRLALSASNPEFASRLSPEANQGQTWSGSAKFYTAELVLSPLRVCHSYYVVRTRQANQHRRLFSLQPAYVSF